jgi:hypothetical protein
MKEKSASQSRRWRHVPLAISVAALISTAVTAGLPGLTVGQALAQSNVRRATTETCAQSKATVERLRTMSISQLDSVFETLPANPPFPNGQAQGYAWLDSTNKTPIQIQDGVHPIWQGKTFYNILGTHIVYDLFFGAQVPPGIMHYGTSHIDGRGVLVFDWRAYTPFFDEVRMIEPGVYIGNSFSDQSLLGTTLLAVIPTVLSVAGIRTNQQFQPYTPLINVIMDVDCPTTFWAS